METKEFHLGDVLSITTERLVSPRHMQGVYAILNFMTGDNLSTHQLPRAMDECKPYLLRQHPDIDTPRMTAAIADLNRELENVATNKEERKQVVMRWLDKQVMNYGEMLKVRQIHTASHEKKHPVDEMVEMMGGREKVTVVESIITGKKEEKK